MSKEDAYMDGLLNAYLNQCEAAVDKAEWIEERAEELLTQPEIVYDIASDHLMPEDDNYEYLIPELLRDMVLLHNKHPSDLSGSDLLARLYQAAKALHHQAMEFAEWKAEKDYEDMITESENTRAEALYDDWDDDL